jgi:hypothetical protein
VSRLGVLSLHNNNIGDEGALALAASPYFTRLSKLGLSGNHLSEAGENVLRGRFGKRVALDDHEHSDVPF